MIRFDLRDASPESERVIVETFSALMRRYPFAPLRQVSLYQPREHDTSMGATESGGKIRLNAYWFAGSPGHLDAAAKRDVFVDADGVRIAWHGPMVDEPQHLIFHEFFHCVAQAAPKYDAWAKDAWHRSTVDPKLAPSGYALTNPDEFWAEAMACRELGFEFGLTGSLEDFLRGNLPQ